jgi:hypothetical protein
MERIYALLLGAASAESRIRIAIMGATIGATVVHPLVAGLDDDTLRRELMHVGRRLFDITDSAEDNAGSATPGQ